MRLATKLILRLNTRECSVSSSTEATDANGSKAVVTLSINGKSDNGGAEFVDSQ